MAKTVRGIVLNGFDSYTPFDEAVAKAGGQRELGDLIGLTRERIRQMQREGGPVTRVVVAERIEKATGVPKVELVGWAKWQGPERHPEQVITIQLKGNGNGKEKSPFLQTGTIHKRDELRARMVGTLRA